jgi:exonuclease VII small subunit
MSGASGPSTIRYISIPAVGLQFSEESIKRMPKDENELAHKYKNNLSEQHTLPEELTSDVHKLNAAYNEFEEAQAVFKRAEEKLSQQRQGFRKTEAGKFIEGLRYPSPKLTLRDILSEQAEALIRADAEKLGEIESWTPMKQAYSFVTIEIKFKKGSRPMYGQCVEFKSNGFKCHQVSYDGGSEKIRTLTIKYEDSKNEAPHIRQDHVEVELNSKLIMYRSDEEKAIKETFGWLKICGYNQADYEDTIKRICSYYESRQAEPLAPEMTKQEIAEALVELGHDCDNDCDCPY